jgi:hypothetical protein
MLLFAERGFRICLALLVLRRVKESHRQHRQRFRPSLFSGNLEKNVDWALPYANDRWVD